MEIVRNPSTLQTMCTQLRRAGSVGLVPTMGALHAGHIELVRAARRQNDITVVSIFVNPTQFGPNEDLSRYPRQLQRDCEMLEQEGVQVVFAPEADAMYPAGSSTWVEVEGVSSRLCGASRPGHFRGVATVVLKLFNLVVPDRAYFGQKDAAQVAVLRRMVTDLNLPLQMVVCPIVRDHDGLALSSRNAYLSAEERHQALSLSRALKAMAAAYGDGVIAAARLIEIGGKVLAETPGVRLDYLEAVDAHTLLPVEEAGPGTLFAVAAWVGSTRLIDNAWIGPTSRVHL